MSLEIVQIEVGLGQNFCEIIGCTETGEAALVDPAFEVDRLLAQVRNRGWRVSAILLTHSHLDHINGVGEATSATGAPTYCHPVEVERVRQHGGSPIAISDEETVGFGRGEAVALYAPGHTPGCVLWHLPEESALITGDVLFIGSCGTIALPDSDPRAMLATLQRIAALPEETRIYPGHDYGKHPTSSILVQTLENPALQVSTVEELCRYKRVPLPPDSVG